MKNYAFLIFISLCAVINYSAAEHTAEEPTLTQTAHTVQPVPALVGKHVTQQGTSPQHYAYDDKTQHHEMKENTENNAKNIDNASEFEDEQTFTTMPYTGSQSGVIDFRDVDNDDIERMRQEDLSEESIQY